jgi:hypothetical protein
LLARLLLALWLARLLLLLLLALGLLLALRLLLALGLLLSVRQRRHALLRSLHHHLR